MHGNNFTSIYGREIDCSLLTFGLDFFLDKGGVLGPHGSNRGPYFFTAQLAQYVVRTKDGVINLIYGRYKARSNLTLRRRH